VTPVWLESFWARSGCCSWDTCGLGIVWVMQSGVRGLAVADVAMVGDAVGVLWEATQLPTSGLEALLDGGPLKVTDRSV
jgi:hypothetical protein